MKSSKRLAMLFLVLATAAVAQAPAKKPPAARRVHVVDHDFGLTLPDPYRWMEGENNTEFNAWLKAKGATSRAKLDALPTLSAWRQRLAKVAGATTTHRGHRLVGQRLFFLRAPAGKEGMLMVRESDGREHTVFDPNTQNAGASIGNYSPSPSGSKGHDQYRPRRQRDRRDRAVRCCHGQAPGRHAHAGLERIQP